MSFFIVRFCRVVAITLSLYICFRIILTVPFNRTLVNNEVASKLMNLYPSLNSSGQEEWLFYVQLLQQNLRQNNFGQILAAFKFLSSKVISFLLCKVLVCTVDRKKTNNSGIFPTLRCYSLDYRSYYMCYNCQEEMVFGKITDITTHKSAISYQKILQKYVKAKLDIGFLKKCK